MTASAPAPETFDHYDIERELGRGAMGKVYLARDRRIGRRVALKTISVSRDQFDDASSATAYFQRLQREAEVCGSLAHPNIVMLYEPGYRDGRIAWIAIEFVEGETLLAAMKRHRPAPLPQDFVTRVAADVLRGLDYAHQQGVIHRDIKPANILLSIDGTAKIGDFGIARPQHSSLTGAGALMGTPNYMPPEQVLGQALTPKADIFSTGVMLYDALTTTKPFAASDVTVVLHNVIRHTPPDVITLNPNVDPALSDLIRAMMSKNAADRPTAADALARLQRLREPAAPVRDAPTQVLPGRTRWSRPISPVIGGAIIGAIFLSAAIPAARLALSVDPTPSVTIPAEKIQEFDAKRDALTAANHLLAAGKYAESIERYDAYLKKYPYSTAALEGKKIAEEQMRPANAKTPQRKRSKRDEDISPSEMLDRIKRLFRK